MHHGEGAAAAGCVIGFEATTLESQQSCRDEHGCAVVQVKYAKPRVERWVNPRLPWRTQHDFVDAVGAPWVASVSLEEYPDAVRRALDAVAREPPRSRLPAEYSDAALLGRVEGWLRGA